MNTNTLLKLLACWFQHISKRTSCIICSFNYRVVLDVFSSDSNGSLLGSQEEYVVGDEVGKLGCKHQYHVKCIYQWLKQKNWCPICKALAAPS